ncbi:MULTISPECIES: EpsG family protein [Psychrilyobacter]|uniref:EpsG family protein n=1 Tax=Psychrilyobacter piezotolerans TaxID=2293438 RepID=A0ABX9KLB8_9FUSO|nr:MULTISPECIES: EpsG family protein [Psychrilyobacter]MCS5420417.1 EpsG family protein [Psychrilyobacter sp. S5]NDI76427.1 EpsG family protein [Psychrilyobacter piezotolerans]RDE66023.1 EpsG family protein [Psychrilyobacter sp. S5]REI43201.1 EpsG family protein [Psychrilyobacter piezotolerans]
MIIYVLLLIILSLILYFKNYYKDNDLGYKLNIIIMLLFTILRYDVGYDFMGYYNWATKSTDYLEAYNRIELINKIFLKITWFINYPQVLIILYGIFIIYYLYIAIKENSANKTLSLYVYLGIPMFFLGSLSMMRQYMALSITLYSVKYIKNNNILKYITTICIATLVHKSAIVILPLYFLKKIKFNKFILTFLLGGSFFFDKVLKFLIIKFIPNYSVYVEDHKGSGGEIIYYLVIFLMLATVMLSDRLREQNSDNNIYINAITIGSLVYISLIKYGHAGIRGSIFYLIFYILIIPQMILCFKQYKILNYICYLAMMILFLATIIISTKSDKSAYIPYQIYFLKN